jgi:predicted NBD/HSP70 family sugar kinase
MRRKTPPSSPLRTPSALAVFRTVLVEGATSRVAISRKTGLTSAAVTKAVTPLLEAGLLRERGSAGGNGVGRPATIVEVAGDAALFAGVKVTGDELIGVVMDLSGAVRASQRRAPRSREVDDVVEDVVALVHDLAGDDAPLRGLGLSLSGDVETDTGLVVFSPFLDWRGVPLEQVLRTRTGLPTVLENDVRALTFAEQWFGAGVGASSFAVVTFGAGIGCGMFVGDRVITGAHGVTGELGHLPVADPRIPCYCGGSGCAEAAASVPAILARLSAAVGADVATLEDAIALATSGDRRAVEVFDDAGQVIGRALACIANLLGPERIVLTGDGLAAIDLLEPGLRSALAQQAYGGAIHSEIMIRPLPFEEWARGAAAVALESFLVNGQ